MKYRPLGKSGIQASTVALGTWAIGGGPWWGPTDDEESVRAIRAALDRGITLIDTAPVYGFGHSEEVVGRAIAGRRDSVVLATKCGLWWDDTRGEAFFEQTGHNVRRTLSPETIRIELEQSLRRLGTDRIDLYQTHWQSPRPRKEPIAATMACLLALKDQGKIRAIGISNASVAQAREYEQAGQLDTLQERYSMLDRHLEEEHLPYCVDRGLALLAYSPLEQGLLTGRIGMDYKPGKDEFRGGLPWFEPEKRRRVVDLLAGWKPLAEKHRCTIAQLVIAWTLDQPGITHALCGARRAAQAEENAGAADVELDSADRARIRRDLEALAKAVPLA